MSNVTTIYTFGTLPTNLSEIAEGMGEATDAEAQELLDVSGGDAPVLIVNPPSGFQLCGNATADALLLVQGGYDVEWAELEENTDDYPSSGELPYRVPDGVTIPPEYV